MNKDRAKLKGYLKDWSKAEIPIFMAYFIDLLSIASRLSLAFQSEKIDPVFALGVLEKAKFRLQLFENKDFEKLPYVKYFLNNVDVQGESVFYQLIELKDFQNAKERVKVQKNVYV